MQPPLDCVQDGDCEPDEVCQSYVVACSCAGDGYTCKLACTDDASCGPDETCDTQSGQCLSRSCDGDGYVCATGTTCVGGGGPDHGCQRNACALDSDCGDGLYCVDNACYSDLGTCAATGG